MPFWPFSLHLRMLMGNPLTPPPLFWWKCYHWMLLQQYLWKERLSRLFSPHVPAIFRHLPKKWLFGHFSHICACSWAILLPLLHFFWWKCYHWTLLQQYLQKESFPGYFHPSPCHFLSFAKTNFLATFPPFACAHGRSLDPSSAFFNKNVITGCFCNDIYIEKAFQVVSTPFSSHFPSFA